MAVRLLLANTDAGFEPGLRNGEELKDELKVSAGDQMSADCSAEVEVGWSFAKRLKKGVCSTVK